MPHRSRRPLAPRALLIAGSVTALVALGGCRRAATLDDRVHALEQRLMAPCCWRQNLADHDSGIAAELRAEVRARLTAGEVPAAVEADLVARYGSSIRALGAAGDDPRGTIGVATVLAALAGLGLVALVTARMVRRGRAAAVVLAPAAAARTAADDDRLDDELAASE